MEKVKDTIYRQDAIDALCKAGCGSGYCEIPCDDVKAIKQLPSPPERKTGKWNFIGNQMFECSECGTCYTQSQFYQMRVRISDTEFPKFCPNCGADMREEVTNDLFEY